MPVAGTFYISYDTTIDVMNAEFVPAGFNVPLVLETSKFRLRMLSQKDAEKDYGATMSSVNHLKGTFGPKSIWPVEDLTLKENRVSIQLHEDAFRSRTAFAYSALSHDKNEYLGCVYIYPSDKQGFDAVAFMWVKESEKQIDPELYQTVKDWLGERWPFKNVAWPGRNISWDEWDA